MTQYNIATIQLKKPFTVLKTDLWAVFFLCKNYTTVWVCISIYNSQQVQKQINICKIEQHVKLKVPYCLISFIKCSKFGLAWVHFFTRMWYFPSKIRFVSCIGIEDVINTRHYCHVVNLANRETAVSSSVLLQSLWISCASWVSRLLSKRYRGTLMPHVTVTWRRFKSYKFSNRHALLQVSRRSVFMVLHEVEHTFWIRCMCGWSKRTVKWKVVA